MIQKLYLYTLPKKNNVETLYDNHDVSASVKLNDADLIDITIRAIVSDKIKNQVETRLREKAKAAILSPKECVRVINDFYTL